MRKLAGQVATHIPPWTSQIPIILGLKAINNGIKMPMFFRLKAVTNGLYTHHFGVNKAIIMGTWEV